MLVSAFTRSTSAELGKRTKWCINGRYCRDETVWLAEFPASSHEGKAVAQVKDRDLFKLKSMSFGTY